MNRYNSNKYNILLKMITGRKKLYTCRWRKWAMVETRIHDMSPDIVSHSVLTNNLISPLCLLNVIALIMLLFTMNMLYSGIGRVKKAGLAITISRANKTELIRLKF